MAPPVAIVCVGMAGSGKTTLIQRLNSHLHMQREPPYLMNLDPAVHNVPFEPNIDIRDSINYKEVMSQYNLGPNGGILTSLNLFATKVDQILAILEKRCGVESLAAPTGEPQTSSKPNKPRPSPIQNIIVDTPGQIEVFVWSASGQILLSSLASTFPTVIAYVIDTPRTASTSTFMSNMLYACSILYKTKLPMILVFNKTDVQSADFAHEWMTDFEAFQAALQREEETGRAGGTPEGKMGPSIGGSGYMNSLINSMSLVLEEFYKHLNVVGVSSVTGDGVDSFFAAVQEKAKEFELDYRPELEKRQKDKEREKDTRREKELGKLMKDLNVENGSSGTSGKGKATGPKREEPETVSDVEDDEDPGSGMVEPDDEEDEDEGEDQDSGLARRYKEAMEGSGDQSSLGDDLSFARFMHSSQTNR
ncbi:MAG: hypothetical protein M1828_004493 [Chrysothrix sp. TS-e1954]|nr:MAG: hypothetical protein M1828_004493 [Chrysothrix sp. TS-e1954]